MINATRCHLYRNCFATTEMKRGCPAFLSSMRPNGPGTLFLRCNFFKRGRLLFWKDPQAATQRISVGCSTRSRQRPGSHAFAQHASRHVCGLAGGKAVSFTVQCSFIIVNQAACKIEVECNPTFRCCVVFRLVRNFFPGRLPFSHVHVSSEFQRSEFPAIGFRGCAPSAATLRGVILNKSKPKR